MSVWDLAQIDEEYVLNIVCPFIMTSHDAIEHFMYICRRLPLHVRVPAIVDCIDQLNCNDMGDKCIYIIANVYLYRVQLHVITNLAYLTMAQWI